jgi:hypothetical protein
VWKTIRGPAIRCTTAKRYSCALRESQDSRVRPSHNCTSSPETRAGSAPTPRRSFGLNGLNFGAGNVSSANSFRWQELRWTAYPPPRFACVIGAARATVDTVWYAASIDLHRRTPTGWRIALDSHGRTFPPELIPDTPIGETKFAMIDGRLHSAANPQSPDESHKPISKRIPLPPQSALVARCFADSDLFSSQAEFAFVAIQSNEQ